MRKLIKEGADLIHSFEGLELESYADPASDMAGELRKKSNNRTKGWEKLSGEPWTIGYGATGLDYFNLDSKGQPTRIGPGLTWTKEQCKLRGDSDLAKFSLQVEAVVKVPLNDFQFAALVSFAYNCGIGNLKSSTLLRRVNESSFTAAAMEFLKWNKAQGKVMAGLTRRREAEKALFSKKNTTV